MQTVKPVLNEKLLALAKETIRVYGDQIPEDAQNAILEQRVTLGMSPYEAKLAAGAFHFKVNADPTIWSANADPNIVIAKQATHPDNSKIWMTFETATQFPDDGLTRFTVSFEKGRAVKIEKSGVAK